MSRSSGREDFLKASAYILGDSKDNEIILDFQNVKVLTPSWADEFITGLKTKYTSNLKYINTNNQSVHISLETVLNPIDIKNFQKNC